MLKRLVLLIISTASFALIAALILRTNAMRQGQSLSRSLQTLEASARHLEKSIDDLGKNTMDAAMRLALSPNLVADLNQYNTAKTSAVNARNVMPAARTRLEGFAAKLRHQIEDFRSSENNIDAVVLINANGEVLLSDSKLLPLGSQIDIPVAAKKINPNSITKITPDITIPKNADITKNKKNANSSPAVYLAQNTFSNTMGRTTVFYKGNVFSIGAAPIRTKSKIIGVILTEQRIDTLPKPVLGEAFVVQSGKAIIGSIPAQVKLPKTIPQRPFVIQANANAPLLIFDSLQQQALIASINPVGEIKPGRWALSFNIPNMVDATGLITVDLSARYNESAFIERLVLGFLGATWIIHIIILLLVGIRIQNGIRRIENILDTAPDTATAAQELETQHFAHELSSLINTIHALLSKLRTGGSKEPLSILDQEAPTILVERPNFTNKTAASHENAVFDFDSGSASNQSAINNVSPDLNSEANSSQWDNQSNEINQNLMAIQNATALQTTNDEEAEISENSKDYNNISENETSLPNVKAQATEDSEPPFLDAEPLEAEPIDDEELVDDKELEKDEKIIAKEQKSTSFPKAPTPPPTLLSPTAVKPQNDDPSIKHQSIMSSEADTAIFTVPNKKANVTIEKTDSSASIASDVAQSPTSSPAFISEESFEQHFKETYKEFLRIRETTGESGSLSYEKFRIRLIESRELVVSRHRCNDVRFHVYIKNNKAAIKATPVT
ncbi:MAG: hypothetical protein JW841_01900 [Deltaproteobacteria bacterium]|nr:hypothetical protein [Deltaproteobacteria bacterium]